MTRSGPAAGAAELVLTASGDLKTALAGLGEICEQAAQARRALKAAIGGRKTPAVRPGGLRDKVLAHLNEHPDKEFTPHEIHKVLGHSSGAISNAGHPGQARRNRGSHRQAAPVPPDRPVGRSRPRDGQRGRRGRRGAQYRTGGCGVTAPHGSRGGSVPPRLPAGQPQQWFTLLLWIFDVTWRACCWAPRRARPG